LIEIASNNLQLALNHAINLDDESLLRALWRIRPQCNGLASKFVFNSLHHLLYSIIEVCLLLGGTTLGDSHRLRFRKTIQKAQLVIDQLSDVAPDNQDLQRMADAARRLGSIEPEIDSFVTDAGDDTQWPDSDRARKKPRLSDIRDNDGQQPSTRQRVIKRLTSRLSGNAAADVEGLSASAPIVFRKISDEQQCDALALIPATLCQLAQDVFAPAGFSPCEACDSEVSTRGVPVNEAAEMIKTLSALVPLLRRDSKSRIAALNALRRAVLHTDLTEHLDLAHSTGGEWCLQCLRSSSRDLRIAAISTLQAYLLSLEMNSSLTKQNRITALEYLQSLWLTNDPALQETAVLALTRLAQVSGDEELNIILLRLVEYLAHTNSYISGLVYEEIQQLALARQVTTSGLFRPFWRTVGVVVAKNLSSRPLMIEQLCSLLQLQVPALMMLIEEYALPYLVSMGEVGLIEQFAAAHGPSMTSFDICTASSKPTEPSRNLSAILAYLLVQGYAEPEHKIMEVLLAVSTDFSSEDLSGWMNHDSIQIACTLLKWIGDAAEDKSGRTQQAFQFLAAMLLRKPGQHTSSSKRSETLGLYLELHALAIVNRFTVLLNDIEAKVPKIEKKRAITALGEMVKLGKGRTSKALPQICACLRSSFSDIDLCDTAFASWNMLMVSLKQEDIEPLLNQTMAIIAIYWDDFDSHTQQLAHDLIARTLKNFPDMIREKCETMPSLAGITLLAKFEGEIHGLKRQFDERRIVSAFISRLEDENEIVVQQALRELTPLLRKKQDLLQRSVLREKPDPFVASLTRALLDSCVKFHNNRSIAQLCGECLGIIGCLDSNKIEAAVERKTMIATTNFGGADETVEFIMYFLEHVLVKAFLSATTTRAQGFLGWAMQELLNLCQYDDSASRIRTGPSTAYLRWKELPDEVRNTLTPFQTSKYRVAERRRVDRIQYPYFTAGMSHKDWLRGVVVDFLSRASGNNVRLIYDTCMRIVHGQDLSIPAFLFPYAAFSLIISGTTEDTEDVVTELGNVLTHNISEASRKVQDEIRLCSQTIFEFWDYLSRWLLQRRKTYATAQKKDRPAADVAIESVHAQIMAVESLLNRISPFSLAMRAVECKSYARALFHWEEYIRMSSLEEYTEESRDTDLAYLQDIYAEIDEPDGIDGILSQTRVVSIQGRLLEHKKAGRYNIAQGWYQMQVAEDPDDVDVQRDLLDCLLESGQHNLLIDRFNNITTIPQNQLVQLKPYAIESAWASAQFVELERLLQNDHSEDFTSSIGRALLHCNRGDLDAAFRALDQISCAVAQELTPNAITSLENCHESLRKTHVVEDLRLLMSTEADSKLPNLETLRKRLDILGSNVRDKQYILLIRRAAMVALSGTFERADLAASYLTSARLARKAQASSQAFDMVLTATAMGDKSASIEEAKLMWAEGHHRKAIKNLEGAINTRAFIAHDYLPTDGPVTLTTEQQNHQNVLTAKAYLLLGKWLDRAGQSQSDEIKTIFRKSTENYRKWEKGWYYLGRHYNRLLDSEKLMAPGKESQTFMTGELAKLVIENYLRSLMNGSKFVFQTLPKVLTLWFELVGSVNLPPDPRRGNEKFQQHTNATRKRVIEECNKYIHKYIDRIQSAVLYTILPQVVARICHTNPAVYAILVNVVVKVVRAFPNQALWTLLAVAKSQSKDRASRGLTIITKVVDVPKKGSGPSGMTPTELRLMVQAGQRFSDELLRVSEFPIEGKISKVSLSRDLGFNHKIAPSRLVVPVETCLMPSIPTSYDSAYLNSFRAFDKEPITISLFQDEALVLSSLQKPRKLSIRGSDGEIYGVLAKPKDDLRKDQRLMEFSTMINRFLKRDVAASKRRLYIRTYAVIPLNEECGLIEWVNNLKTFRDIILKLYKDRSIQPNYTEIRTLLDESCSGPPAKTSIFTERVLANFPPIFYEWFVESFPNPTNWFAARLRYTRACAVMSIVGHVLGLGDRHGENILFEEDNGSLMHVDFNCLFDKGLTFEKPEHVPFRLTHNMVDAMGPYRYEGPWRRCSEITLSLLRSNEDALMTILETFLHDPTTDFLEKERRRKKAVPGVPNSPLEVLESVRGKLRGFLQGESVPLSVPGYVQTLVQQATDEARLCRMYIGWCAFF
jgi:serine/threonine-protein kinase ATR